MLAGDVGRELDRDGWIRVLLDLDTACVQRDLDEITLLVIGGAAMALAHGDRSTTDLDVLNEHLPQPYRQAAEAVAEIHGLRADWLNDGGKGFAPTLISSEPHHIVFAGTLLQVVTPPATYLLATKLRAAREQDLIDVHKLMRLTRRTSESDLLGLLQLAYPGNQLSVRMQYFAASAAAAYRS